MNIRRPVGAWCVWHPPDFGRSVNPISTGGHIMPTTLQLTPRIFRPSYDPVLNYDGKYDISLIRFPPILISNLSHDFFHENQRIKLVNDQTTIRNIFFWHICLKFSYHKTKINQSNQTLYFPTVVKTFTFRSFLVSL